MGRVVRFVQPFLFCTASLLMIAGTMRAQDALPVPARPTPRFGGPQDWSDRHIIYTLNSSPEDMLKLRDDPRFLNSIFLHYMREHRSQTGQPTTAGLNEPGLNEAGLNEAGSNEDRLSEDGLSEDRLNEDTLGEETFDDDAEDAQPLLQPDRRRHHHHHHHRHHRNKHSKVDWSISLGPTAGLPIGETPGVYTYNYAAPSCSTLAAVPPVVGDFVVYTINAAPTIESSTVAPGQANLVALTNLYTDGAGTGYCSGTGPSFLFSYAIGSGGSALSPVLSYDGTRVAWIENPSATTSYLHVTIWVANQGISATDPVAPTGTFSSGTCTPAGTSCDYALEYTAATPPGCTTAHIAGNGHSDLYVDYPSNSGFISANNGLLYHIKNIFSTTANPTVDFCVPVNTTFETTPSSAMSGPVYDPLINEVFITDSENIYAYTVNASATTPNFALAASHTYGNSASNYNYPTGPGPLLDAYNGYVYVFSTYDAAGKTSVTQLPTSLASAVAVELGPESTNVNPLLFYGAFDNNYYKYGPANATSTLYSCGTDTTTPTSQDLFAISFNPNSTPPGLANTTPAMSANTHVNPGGTNGLCSPITEFYDGSTDRIFVGMGEAGATSGSNVVTMWNVTNRLTSSSTYTAEATGYMGGSSGIAADNSASGTAQAESIYFSTEDAGSSSTAVSDAAAYNVYGIYSNGFPFGTGGLDNDGNAYSANLLGTTQTWNGTTFTFGPANGLNVWANTTITLPSGSFSTLEILAAAVNGNQASQTLTVNYTDGATTTLTQSFSDWYTGPVPYAGESEAVAMAYETTGSGGYRDHATFIYGYSFGINANKTVASLTLPANRNVCVLAVALSTNCGGKDYCAVKLTQSGLQ